MTARTILFVTFLTVSQLPGCASYTTGPDRPPVAAAGADLTVEVGNSAEIDGSGSFDPEGEPLEFIWCLVAAPGGGRAELSDLRGEITVLTPDAAGVWLVRLTVFDGVYSSDPDLVRILAVDRVVECQTDADCDDSDPCTENTCGPDDRCRTAPAADGTSCDDGDPCSSADECRNGVCASGDTDLDFDSDGYLDGECPGGTDCDDSDAGVHPGSAEGPPGDATCTDGRDNDCDGQSDGADTGCRDCTQDSDCNDGNPCTQDDCLPSGVCDNPPVQDGTPCDDGLYCSNPDGCASGSCTGPARDCSSLDDQCNLGECSEDADSCIAAPKSDGTPCDDGDPCSSQDSCQSGGCSPGDTDKDSDGDGYLDGSCPGGDDCDDSTANANPGLSEGPGGSAFCSDLLDNDCDGQTDDDDPGCATDWWNTDWTRRRKLTFDNSGQQEHLDWFPVLVKLNSGRIDHTQTRNNGEDLRFVDDDDQTVLAHEIELWNESGDSFVWVKVPRVDSGSAGDFIWMYYGNGSGQDQQDAAAVWSTGYRAVWHLNEQVSDENTGASHADSTGNNNTGTQYGNNDHPGMMADGQEFDGIDDYIEIAESGFTGFNRAITIEAWANLYEVVSDFPHIIGAGPPGSGRHWQIWWDPGAVGWGGRLSCNGKQGYVTTSLGSVGGWNYVVIRYDGSNISIFVDGDWGGSTGEDENLDPPGSPLWIGINHNLTPRMFKGVIDEVRISDAVRSDRWIRAQHLSMTDAFITFGNEETR